MGKKVFIIDDHNMETENLRTYFSTDFDVIPFKTETDLNEYSDAFNNVQSLETYVKRIITENYQDLRLIVSDIRFDDFKGRYDGIKLIKQIREWKIPNAHPDYCKFIPIIATSKVTGMDYLYKAYCEANATLYIDKDYKDRDGNILGLKEISRQMIPLFDSWCEMVGDSRYRIAFSFTGKDNANNEKHRAFVREIAESLSRRCRTSVFFDEFYGGAINGNTGRLMSNVYRSQSEKIVVFLSNDYNDTRRSFWTSKEWLWGIKPYIQETDIDNLCLINLSVKFNKDKVLPKLFSEIGTDNKAIKEDMNSWNLIYKDFSDQRDFYYSIISNRSDNAPAAFQKYIEFKKEKLKTIVDFIISRFNLRAVVPD